MSALPAEVPPSGAVPAATETGPRGRSRTGGAQARPSVHPLFPSKRWLLPDGDCIFPGGGRRFSGQTAPPARRSADAWRPAVAQRRPDAQRTDRPRAGIRALAMPAGHAAGSAAPRRLRLTRRGRIVVALLAVLAACGLFVAGASAAQASGPASARGRAAQVIVQPGDTLWSIAQSADPNADARAIVQQILQANRLATARIAAGQRLWVPRG
jgi:LysM repeat protein